LKKIPSSHEKRNATQVDIPILNEIYTEEFAEISGIIVRPLDMWWSFLRKIRGELIIFVGKNDMPEGYVWYEKDNKSKILEIGVSNFLAAKSIIAYLAEQAKSHFQGKIVWSIHPRQRFGKYCACNYNGKFEIHFRKSGAWMGRICNLRSTFIKLLPEFKSRLYNSKFASWTGNVTFKTDIGDVTIKVNDNEIMLSDNVIKSSQSVSIRQENLLQLIFGFKDAHDLIFESALQIDESIIGILEILFPRQLPGMSQIDWF